MQYINSYASTDIIDKMREYKKAGHYVNTNVESIKMCHCTGDCKTGNKTDSKKITQNT